MNSGTFVKFQLTAFLCISAAAFAQDLNGELVLRAIQHSFPGKTGEVAFADNDWTIQVGGETFCWAGGRMLPAAEKDKLDSYSPLSFEVYPKAAPSPAIYSPAYIEALRLRGSDEARQSQEDQHRAFQAILYGGKTRAEIEALLAGVEFLGKKINVHRDIVEALKRVDAEIRAAAKEEAGAGNSGLADFIASIGQAGGYNWRDIRGSQRMSYHSWGMAVDIQPKNSGDKSIYWLWERSRNSDWMLVPLENRWKPPDRLIQAFEREGFIWGGKWPLYDTMHFEYRPELHELNRLLAAQGGAVRGADNRSGQDLHHLYPDQLNRGFKRY
jgi:hypothetical protein